MNPASHPNPDKKRFPKWLKFTGWFLGIMFLLNLLTGLGLKWYGSTQPGGQEGFNARLQAKSAMSVLQSTLWLHKLFNGSYPSEAEGLASLIPEDEKSEVRGMPKNPDNLLDPWKRKFQYRFPGTHNKDSYDLFSLGPDGIEGTEDDITNW